ncbi:hypothetical protein PHJA_002107900 [Phtheirospermum japonicum]|uniref:VQ domain-containing protein n=1 Tax=Phtheirospermum japonicum TaxID=374723 RepID=A0A830CQ20_9LAMI|nr:hypothetical protein PHJA_002107900 [Phtheirospermum japonicum]
MDSGNSGSLQSSSGGDEEYDSRAAASDHSIFMNTHPPPQPPSLFDPFSNYTQPLHHQYPNNFNNNPNAGWPGSTSIRSDPNPNPHPPNIANPFMSSFQPPPPALGADPTTTTSSGGGGRSTAARNPRKRSRASRRAPTTVLTTDTTNFRAMVQEFTGIPAPPFSNPSFPRSNRLDNLFGSRSAALDAAAPPFLRRPFAQRGQTPSFLVPSSTNNNIISSVSNNYQQLPFSHIQTSNNLLNNMNNNPNQYPLFSSLLQTNPSKFIFSNSSVMASKPHNQGSFEIPSNDMKIGPSLDEFGLGGGHGNHQHVTTTLNDLPNLISSDQARARNDRDQERDSENAAKWRRNNNNNNNGMGTHDNEGDGYNNQAQLKPVNGGYDFSGSTSSFQGEKSPGPDNVATTRAGDQGMVESWIYSSE